MISLTEKTRLVRFQHAQNNRDLRRHKPTALRTNRASFVATERAAACGETMKLYLMIKRVSRRPTKVDDGLLLNTKTEALSQTRPDEHVGRLCTSKSSLIMQHDIFTNRYPLAEQNSCEAGPPFWMRCARLSVSC